MLKPLKRLGHGDRRLRRRRSRAGIKSEVMRMSKARLVPLVPPPEVPWLVWKPRDSVAADEEMAIRLPGEWWSKNCYRIECGLKSAKQVASRIGRSMSVDPPLWAPLPLFSLLAILMGHEEGQSESITNQLSGVRGRVLRL